MKKLLNVLVVVMLLSVIVGCANASNKMNYPEIRYSNEEYLEIKEEEYIETSKNDRINISMDSSTAAYSNLRRMIKGKMNIPSDAVVIEQMLSYFNYSYENDTEEALKAFTEVSDCPWNRENKLLQVVVKARNYEIENPKPNNFVFLLDVSGSMYSADKLPLMIEAFKLLVDNLNDSDRVSIVTYAGSEQVLLDGGFGYEKPKITAIMSDLEANGRTHGSAGIKKAYEIASKYYIEGGNNRVFLATDCDFNVGISSMDGLKKFISSKRDQGIYLSLFGFGSGNLKSSTMDTLAQHGNGNYYYIDSVLEAKKVFVSELGGTLNTVAKDCKAQIVFNKDVVESYRLIGYENKQMSDDDFNNTEKDAGEIGAGHTTICLVELKLKENVENKEIAACTVRYKDVPNEFNKEITSSVSVIKETPSNDFLFASSVVEFGLLLRNSTFKADASYDSILSRINKEEFMNDPYKKEFYELVKMAKEYIK